MAKYYNISKEEMHEFLTGKGFTAVTPPNTVELVYGKRVDQQDLQLTLRVYTGVLPGGSSRGVGDDAIRVNLFLRTEKGNVVKIGGSKRVHRVEGWRKNLESRIDGWLDYLPKEKCKKCGLPMLVRENRKTKDKFLACSDSVVCKSTRSL